MSHRTVAIAGALAALCVMLAGLAFGQHNHAQHHDHYSGWVNQDGKGCCNNQDCGQLGEDDERTSNGKLEVRVEGQWCPVLSVHYLKSGNVPNASVAHVCVLKYGNGGPCERFICYQPRPLS